jgi:hypothetical protein
VSTLSGLPPCLGPNEVVAVAVRLSAFVVLGFLFVILLPSAAFAQSVPVAGPEVALRTGLALPFGSIRGGATARDLDLYASTVVPIVVEGGYRIDPSLFVGLRFQYAVPQLEDPNPTFACGGGNACRGSVVQLGAEAIYRVLASRRFAPWLGLGAGYEWLSADYKTTNAATNLGFGGTNRGFQGLVQVGGDLRVGQKVVLGPFVEVAAGRYTRAENRGFLGAMSGSMDVDITDVTWHGWVTLGLRAAFGS